MTEIIKDICIIGHPRSGTSFIAYLLQLNGIDVLHEKMGRDGISSWMFAIRSARDVPFYFDSSVPVDFKFLHYLHVVRDPIKAISSIFYTEDASEGWRSRHCVITGNKMERVVTSYIQWNKMILAQNPELTFRLESPQVLLNYLNKEYQGENLYTKIPSGKINIRQHPDFTLDEIADRININLYSELIIFDAWYKSLPTE